MTETRAPVERTYRPRLAGLDAVRVFAAVSVMVFHLGFWSWAAPSTAGTIVQGAVAYQHHVRRSLHYQAGYGNGMDYMLQCAYGAAVAMFIHDAGIECNVAVAVGIARVANRVVVGVCFRHFYAGFHSIQCATAFFQDLPGGCIGRTAKVPGRYHNRFAFYGAALSPGACSRSCYSLKRENSGTEGRCFQECSSIVHIAFSF